MSLYEHVFIARPDMSPQQAEDLIKTYGDIVCAEGGSVGKTEYWGLRNMAYRIKRFRKGHYSLMNIDAPHKAVAEMERRMRLSSEVLRFLTIRVDAHDDKPSLPKLAMNERGSRRTTVEMAEAAEDSGTEESDEADSSLESSPDNIPDEVIEEHERGSSRPAVEAAENSGSEESGEADTSPESSPVNIPDEAVEEHEMETQDGPGERS